MFPNKRIEEYYVLYSELLNFSNLSWWIIDLENNPDIFYCNKVMCNAFSLDENIIQHSVSKTCPIAGDYNTNVAIKSTDKAKKIFSEYNQLKMGNIEEYSNTFPYFSKSLDNKLYFSSRAKALLKDELGNAVILFGIIEPELISAELFIEAKTDSLTGLNNRREFDSQLTFLMNLANREQHYISLILCDVDNFKKYNDTLGHYAGDECLMNIATSILKMCSRNTDIACRYGGEEFAIIFYGDKNEASLLAEAIRLEVHSMAIAHPAQNNEPVTISVGYTSIIPDSASNPKTLIECADKALYQAKSNGKNICVGFQGKVKNS